MTTVMKQMIRDDNICTVAQMVRASALRRQDVLSRSQWWPKCLLTKCTPSDILESTGEIFIYIALRGFRNMVLNRPSRRQPNIEPSGGKLFQVFPNPTAARTAGRHRCEPWHRECVAIFIRHFCLAFEGSVNVSISCDHHWQVCHVPWWCMLNAG